MMSVHLPSIILFIIGCSMIEGVGLISDGIVEAGVIHAV
jgi:hypothetical protein